MQNTQIKCHNLRPSDIPGVLEPVPSAVVAAHGAHHPLCHSTAAQAVITVSGLTIYAVGDTEPYTSTAITTLPHQPLCAEALGPRIVIMTTAGAYTLLYGDGCWTDMGYEPQWPTLTFGASSSLDFSVAVDERALSQSYSRGQQLSPKDKAAVSADLTEAYRTLHTDAASLGYCLQPLLACYRLLNADGHELMRSAPVIIAPEQGPQLTSATILRSTDASRSAVESYTVQAAGFMPTVTLPQAPSDAWTDSVAAAEIMVSPLLQPLDPKGEPDCLTIARGSTSDFLRLYLPGCRTAPSSVGSASAASMVREVIARAAGFECVMRINNPMSRHGTITLPLPSRDVDTHIDNLRKLLKKPLLPATGAESHLLPPHRIAARAMCAASGAMLRANLAAIRYDGYPLPMMASQLADRPWCAAVTVTFADGEERAIWHDSGNTGAPWRFGSVLAYPAPDAVSIDIRLSVDGEPYRHASFPLTPLPGSRAAVYISPGFTPIELPAAVDGDVFSVPTAVVKTHRYPSMTAISPVDAPQDVAALAAADHSEILSVGAAASGGAWDFGRARFYLFGSGGIHVLAAYALRGETAVTLIDPRPVASGCAAVRLSGASAYAVIAGGDIVEISRQKASTIATDITADALGWDSQRRELWCLSSQSLAATVICRSRGDLRYTASVSRSPHVLSVAGRGIFTGSADSLSILAKRKSLTMVEWSGRLLPKRAPIVPTQLVWPLSGSAVNGSITLSHSHIPGGGELLLHLRIAGSVLSPIRARLVGRAVDNIHADFMATVSTDFHICPCIIE